MKLGFLAAMFVLAAGAAQASGLTDDDSAVHQAACKAVAGREPTAAQALTPAEAKALKGCDAEALYYGEGVARDYVNARLCALAGDPGAGTHDASSPDKAFGAGVILMQVYANGRGAPRDLDLALAYACDDDAWASAEFEGRLDDLIARRDHPITKPFDYCDDITSGYMQGMCAGRESTLAGQKRDAWLKRCGAHVAAAARGPYAELKRAEEAFATAHGQNEVDLSGTGRGAFEIGAEDEVSDAFQKHLAALANNSWPAGSAADAQAADAALNAAYRAALDAGGQGGTVEGKGVRVAQRLWLAYRDAFVRFAHAEAPDVDPARILAELSRERTLTLKDLAS